MGGGKPRRASGRGGNPNRLPPPLHEFPPRHAHEHRGHEEPRASDGERPRGRPRPALRRHLRRGEEEAFGSLKILVTGAGGNIGRGVVPKLLALGHDVVLSDLNRLPDDEATRDLPFHQLDVQAGFGLEKAAEGCDLILHTPAWHGIHWNQKTEADFWRLNVDGAFWAFQAARSAGISRFVFLSSQSWHGHYDKYGFTKRIGEELCEYHRRANGIRYVTVRPADLTPWGNDWPGRYGTRLLYGGVDREDVLDAVTLAVERLLKPLEGEAEGIVLDAVRANGFSAEDLAGWEEEPLATCERIFPGSAEIVARYGLRIERKPSVVSSFSGWAETGYAPSRHFGTFLEELRRIEASGGEAAVRAMVCPY
ncbi:NAD(P)-dependent oxidoreductase [bacterium]|nr:MAG: NAD(P)-dependent oxidoreductase [bacterium]